MLPSIVIFLKDLTFIEDGNPTFVDAQKKLYSPPDASSSPSLSQ